VKARAVDAFGAPSLKRCIFSHLRANARNRFLRQPSCPAFDHQPTFAAGV